MCLGRASWGASLPQPAVEHSGYVMHMYILYVRTCVIELFVLLAGDLGSIDITSTCPSWTSVSLRSKLLHGHTNRFCANNHSEGTAPGRVPLAWMDMWVRHMDGATKAWQPSTMHCFLTGVAKEVAEDWR